MMQTLWRLARRQQQCTAPIARQLHNKTFLLDVSSSSQRQAIPDWLASIQREIARHESAAAAVHLPVPFDPSGAPNTVSFPGFMLCSQVGSLDKQTCEVDTQSTASDVSRGHDVSLDPSCSAIAAQSQIARATVFHSSLPVCSQQEHVGVFLSAHGSLPRLPLQLTALLKQHRRRHASLGSTDEAARPLSLAVMASMSPRPEASHVSMTAAAATRSTHQPLHTGSSRAVVAAFSKRGSKYRVYT